ncbi:preprotein translocase subunit YajC [Plebeiibacterium sediminum]|uniref:Sec translocon accessory complex subunit YajC n=1 Tax=Plebeiibacterium sediminum TaxID=2992112 RepID=A0AAE3M7R1_9BACT|nr:preprotein translocase subunit YajC [Plebeiobacterium sediminum]MCW3788095.1 preprotein translocase subunit YajC [Plebeiobacterium sediminum]
MNLQALFLQQQAAGGQYQFFIMMGLLIVVFYFFMIRPQQKRQKQLRQYREALKKGDKVITTGGIYGKVSEVKETYINVEISNGVVIKIDKSAIIMDMSDAQPKR